MRISAIIPAYNRERYLAEAVQSVVEQSRPVDEIIVVDDGSTDGTAIVARGLPVKLVQLAKNRGPAAARNAGIKASTGDLMAWLDSDDLWLPHHTDCVVGLLERHPGVNVAFGLVELFGDKEGVWTAELPEDTAADAFWPSFDHTLVPMQASVIRRQALVEIGGFDESLTASVDFDLFLRLALQGPFVCSHKTTGRYRWHRQQISGNPRKQLLAVYESRLRLATRMRQERPQLAVEIDRRLMAKWESDLSSAWVSRNLEVVRALMKLAERMPSASPAWRHLRFRQYAPRTLLAVWDRRPGAGDS